MKIATNKSSLLHAINSIAKAIPNNPSKEILKCCKLECVNSKIVLTGNNLEMGVEVLVEGFVIEEGALCCDFKLLSSIVPKLPDEQISIATNEEMTKMMIKSGKSYFNTPVLSADPYPSLPLVEDVSTSIMIKQKEFGKMIKGVAFACADSRDGKSKSFTCIHLEMDGTTVTCVGCDGFRIAVRKTTVATEKPIAVNVPCFAALELARIFNTVNDVKVGVTDRHLIAEADGSKMVITLVGETYFEYGRLLGLNTSTDVTVETDALIGTLERSVLLIRGESVQPLVFSIKDNILNVSVATSIGTLAEDIEIKETVGEELKIGFNPFLLMDMVRAIGSNTITMQFVNENSPLSVVAEDGSYHYLCLPLAIKDQKEKAA